MSATHWERVQALFASALEQPPERRAAYVAAAVEDPDVRREVLALLLAHEERGRFDRVADDLHGLGPAAASVPLANLVDRLRTALAGRYTIERELGRGGMATVWLAQDLKHARSVALKVLRPELAAALGPERFMREITLTAGLDHPHILPLLDSGEAAGSLFYVMPYVEGESLRDRLTRERQLPLEDALQITGEVADALSYAHHRGVVHRDIKPENILLAAGHARVADFGIARAIAAAGGDRLTETGIAVGTPAYMSPEQAVGEQALDGRSDIYSLATVLYELLAGDPPFSGTNPQAINARKTLDPVPPLRTAREAVSPDLERVILKALARVPADRFATAVQFRAALEGSVRAAVSAEVSNGAWVWVRRAVVASAALAAIAAAAFAVPRLLRAPVPRPLPLDTIAVAIFPFRVLGSSGDVAWLREGAMDLLGIALDGLGEWRVVSPRTLLPRAVGFTDRTEPSQGSRIARSVGAATMVFGRAVATGPDLRVTVELYDARRSDRLAEVTASGHVANLGVVIDSLAVALGRLRGASQSGRRSPGEYTTASPGALRPYLVAEQLMRRAEWSAAAESLHHAIARDSSFALAWYQLLRTEWWGGVESGLGTDSILAGAMRDVARLPRRMQLVLRALHPFQRGLRLESVRRADELAAAFPDDAEAMLVAADNYFHYGLALGEPPRRMLADFERAIDLDPGMPEAYLHVVNLHTMLGDSGRAWQAFERMRAAAPNWDLTGVTALALRALFRMEDPVTLAQLAPGTAWTRVGDHVLFGEAHPARAVALADSFTAMATAADQPRTARVGALLRRQDYRLAQGRYAEAWEMVQAAAALDAGVLGRTMLHHLVTGSKAPEADEAARRLASLARPPWVTEALLLTWYRGVRTDLNSSITRPVHPASPWWRETFRPYRDAVHAGLEGLVALQDGDTARARRQLATAWGVGYPFGGDESYAPDRRFALALARLERAAGDLDAAARRLDYARFPNGVLERAEFEELRGQIAEQRGDTVAAIRAYGTFIGLWNDADPELQPRVAVARAALARLER